MILRFKIIVFVMKCFYPRLIHCKSDGHTYEVPCGKCPACRKRKQSEWVLRMEHEQRFGDHKHCFFLTLTYDDSVVPTQGHIDSDTGEVTTQRVLSHDDHRGFWKRYRNYSGDSCMYFSCGEYGDKFNRPHFHAVIYTNLSWSDCLENCKRAWSYSVPNDTPLGYGVYERKGIYDTRRKLFGLVTLSSINIRRMRYCAKYIVKDSNSSALVPKFARASKRLGLCFLRKSSEWLPAKINLRPVLYTTDCKPVAMPRYYSHRIFTREELDKIHLDYLNSQPCCPVTSQEDYERVVKWTHEQWSIEQRQQQSCMLSRYNLFACYG